MPHTADILQRTAPLSVDPDLSRWLFEQNNRVNDAFRLLHGQLDAFDTRLNQIAEAQAEIQEQLISLQRQSRANQFRIDRLNEGVNQLRTFLSQQLSSLDRRVRNLENP